MASQQFQKGDRVQWSSGSGKTTGKIEKRITEDQQVDGKTVSATEDDPRYLVRNDSTGNVTGHRPDTLSKADSSSSGSGSSDSDSSDSDSFEKGDRVEWNTSQGKTTGTVKEKLTETTDIKGHTAKASEDDPQYLVESESTGSEAAHKPSALDPAE